MVGRPNGTQEKPQKLVQTSFKPVNGKPKRNNLTRNFKLMIHGLHWAEPSGAAWQVMHVSSGHVHGITMDNVSCENRLPFLCKLMGFPCNPLFYCFVTKGAPCATHRQSTVKTQFAERVLSILTQNSPHMSAANGGNGKHGTAHGQSPSGLSASTQPNSPLLKGMSPPLPDRISLVLSGYLGKWPSFLFLPPPLPVLPRGRGKKKIKWPKVIFRPI